MCKVSKFNFTTKDLKNLREYFGSSTDAEAMEKWAECFMRGNLSARVTDRGPSFIEVTEW